MSLYSWMAAENKTNPSQNVSCSLSLQIHAEQNKIGEENKYRIHFPLYDMLEY